MRISAERKRRKDLGPCGMGLLSLASTVVWSQHGQAGLGVWCVWRGALPSLHFNVRGREETISSNQLPISEASAVHAPAHLHDNKGLEKSTQSEFCCWQVPGKHFIPVFVTVGEEVGRVDFCAKSQILFWSSGEAVAISSGKSHSPLSKGSGEWPSCRAGRI